MALTGKNSCFTTKNGRNKLAGGIMAGFITAGINMAVFFKNRQIKPAILIPCKVDNKLIEIRTVPAAQRPN